MSTNFSVFLGQCCFLINSEFYGVRLVLRFLVGGSDQLLPALPIRSPLGDQGLLRRLFDHFWSPILGKVTLFDSNNQLTLNY